VLAAKYLNWNGKGTCPPAFDSFMQHPERMVANAKTYAPGKPSWWRDPHTISVSRNSIIVNTWAEPEIGRGRNPARTRAITPRVRQETMGLFTKLVEQLTGESGDKEFGLDWRMYNWLALMVADQATKPGWQWLIMSDPGFGKDTLAKLITPLVGEENSTMVGQDDVSSGYNAWAAKKFVVVNELSSAHDGRKKGTALFDHLKPFFTAPPDHITINPKYGKQYTAANVGGYMLFSNQSTPLLIDMGERRLCIVDRRKKPGIISKSEFARLNGIRSNPVALEVIGVWLRERFNNFTVDTLQDLVGNAPKTVAKDELLEVSAGKHEEMIADWIEDANDLGPLWTGDQLKDRLNRAAKDDRALGSMTSYQMARRLKDAGAWKVFMHGDKEGRVPGVGSNGRGRDVVWALYEKPSEGITRDAQLTPDQIRDLLTKQNAERGGGAVTAITGAIKKEAQDVLDEPEDDDAETPQ
jgi:hypothetical protein